MTVERATPGYSGAEPATGQAAVLRAVTAIMGTVVGLTFLFGFGNVLDLALRLDVPVWVAPLVAPAVDLSIVGLLLGTRHLVVQGAGLDSLRGARRLLIFASLVTLALNVADPLIRGQFGKAAFDAIGPLLLIGWSEVGPSLLKALIASTAVAHAQAGTSRIGDARTATPREGRLVQSRGSDQEPAAAQSVGHFGRQDCLLVRAREEDLHHRLERHRPISAETLRRRLHIGATRSRQLVAQLRLEAQQPPAPIHLPTTGR